MDYSGSLAGDEEIVDEEHEEVACALAGKEMLAWTEEAVQKTQAECLGVLKLVA